jgi:hypothetical protein
MGSGNGNTVPPVTSYPPPKPMMAPLPSPPRLLNLVTAAAAATAGFLGFSEVAGILALLSLIFGFWDAFQNRDHHRHEHPRHDAGGQTADPGGPATYTETHPHRPDHHEYPP